MLTNILHPDEGEEQPQQDTPRLSQQAIEESQPSSTLQPDAQTLTPPASPPRCSLVPSPNSVSMIDASAPLHIETQLPLFATPGTTTPTGGGIQTPLESPTPSFPATVTGPMLSRTKSFMAIDNDYQERNPSNPPTPNRVRENMSNIFPSKAVVGSSAVKRMREGSSGILDPTQASSSRLVKKPKVNH